jgi:hypothetical protein
MKRLLLAATLALAAITPATATEPTPIEPGSTIYLRGMHIACIDLIDAADAKWTEESGVHMHRKNRPANSPAPDCKLLSPGAEFKVIEVDHELMGMNRFFRKLCLRPTTANENEACRWAILLAM